MRAAFPAVLQVELDQLLQEAAAGCLVQGAAVRAQRLAEKDLELRRHLALPAGLKAVHQLAENFALPGWIGRHGLDLSRSSCCSCSPWNCSRTRRTVRSARSTAAAISAWECPWSSN